MKAYIGLYILSPVLNSFSDSASCRQFVQVLVPFYIFQTLFGIAGAAPYILNGYSVFSFAGLYLLAKFVRKYCLHYKKQIILGGGISLLLNAIGYIAPRLAGIVPSEYFLTYISPLVVLTSIAILLLFDTIKMRPNRIINWISKSVFAVYIVHQSPFIAKEAYLETNTTFVLDHSNHEES